jgi:hypothetical protein
MRISLNGLKIQCEGNEIDLILEVEEAAALARVLTRRVGLWAHRQNPPAVGVRLTPVGLDTADRSAVSEEAQALVFGSR